VYLEAFYLSLMSRKSCPLTHLTNQDLGCTSHTPRDELDSEIIPLLSGRFGIRDNVLGSVRHFILFFSIMVNVTVLSEPCLILLSDLYYSYLIRMIH
jgi:hypothetical protein